jgi:Protein of unknown function (DUF1566)
MKRILLGFFSALAVFTAHGQTSGLPAGFPESVFKQLLLGGKVQNQGDPNRFSTVPSNPSCRFFDGFADNGDGTVTDPRSGLMWKKCPEGAKWTGSICAQGDENPQMTWLRAAELASTSSFAGTKGWRLPTVPELKAVTGAYRIQPINGLSNNGCEMNFSYWANEDEKIGKIAASKSLEPVGSFRPIQRIYWSSEKNTSMYKDGWISLMDFGKGQELMAQPHQQNYARLVRDGVSQQSVESSDALKKEASEMIKRREESIDKMMREHKEDMEAYREQLKRSRLEGKSRGGVDTFNYLDISKTYGVRCNNGTNDVLTINSVSRTYCGSASNGAWECFQQPASAAQHIC